MQLQRFISLIGILSLTLTAPVAQAAEWSEIRRREHLVVAVKEHLKPLGFRDQQGQLQGFEIDLARQLAQDLLGDSTAVVLKPVMNQDRLTAVVDGEVDVAIANLTLTENRRRIVNFSVPYYNSATRLVTRPSSIRTIHDLKSIAVLQHSHNIAVLRSAFPTTQLIGVKTYQDAIASLKAEQADAFAGDQAVLIGWQQDDSTYRMLGQPLARRSLAIALPKGLQYKSLLEKINQSLEKLSQTGWLEQRQQYWGLE